MSLAYSQPRHLRTYQRVQLQALFHDMQRETTFPGKATRAVSTSSRPSDAATAAKRPGSKQGDEQTPQRRKLSRKVSIERRLLLLFSWGRPTMAKESFGCHAR